RRAPGATLFPYPTLFRSSAHDRREQLLGGLGTVERLDRLEAGVAVATRYLERLAEVGQQRLAPATGRLAERQQRFEPLPFGTFVLLVAFTLGQHARHLDDVLQAVGEERLGALTVSAGPAGLLVVALEA